jgi:alginate O-acetyltransferase complex protein AlgI
MVFTSFNFLIFFPALTILYYLTPSRYRLFTLLAASYFFYINVKPVFAFLVAGITLSTYFFTRLIDNTNIESKKKSFMIVNVILILLPLFFFKYFSVINNGILGILERNNLRWPLPEIKLILPIGISFYTFMAVGYTIDVYNEEIKSEKNIGILALFISFFPLILSGPIERANNMLPQFRKKTDFDYSMLLKGMKLMLWGYFMKLVVADRLGIYVDAVLNNVSQHNGSSLLLASILHPFQVYADLGGYSLIAIGTAKVLGFNVMCNFNRPFFATSMAEFWRRWHISLIKWLTDYVYTPLSFSFRRLGVWGIVIALLMTFLISGIWHGAALTFIVWGLLQGIFLSIESLTSKRKLNLENKLNLKIRIWYIILCCIITYLLFACSLVFGRAASLDDAFMIFRKILTTSGALFIGNPSTFIFCILSMLILLIKDFADEFFPSRVLLFDSKHKIVRVLAYCSIIILILLIGVFDGGQFIYFQF